MPALLNFPALDLFRDKRDKSLVVILPATAGEIAFHCAQQRVRLTSALKLFLAKIHYDETLSAELDHFSMLYRWSLPEAAIKTLAAVASEYREWAVDAITARNAAMARPQRGFKVRTYSELIVYCRSREPIYSELLSTVEWMARRDYIRNLYRNRCAECKSESADLPNKNALEVHHTWYVARLVPWLYPDTMLKLVCASCHNMLHKSETSRRHARNGAGLSDSYFTTCYKCRGSGSLEQFRLLQDGKCFACDGDGVLQRVRRV